MLEDYVGREKLIMIFFLVEGNFMLKAGRICYWMKAL